MSFSISVVCMSTYLQPHRNLLPKLHALHLVEYPKLHPHPRRRDLKAATSSFTTSHRSSRLLSKITNLTLVLDSKITEQYYYM